jgi:hypothetical protein
MTAHSESARVWACPAGPWQRGTIRRANEDGTFQVELDEKAISFMKYWYGVTASELVPAEDGTPEPPPPAPSALQKLYWNQTRMGGRDPGELPRAVTVADVLEALAMVGSPVDADAVGALDRFAAAAGVTLPTTVRELWSRPAVLEAVGELHPNSPEVQAPTSEQWALRRGLRAKGLDGEYSLTIVVPHQGDFTWEAVFDEGGGDARVYLHAGEGEQDRWALTAPGVAFFFWDLAQTGLGWWIATNYKGGVPTARSELGLVRITH